MTDPVLHLVRTRIDRTGLARLAARRGVLDDDLGYALHQALTERFGPRAVQPFRRMEPDAATRRRLDPPVRDGVPTGRDEWDWLLSYSDDPDTLIAASTAGVGEGEPSFPDPSGDWGARERPDDERAVAAVFPEPFEVTPMPVRTDRATDGTVARRCWTGPSRLGFEVLVRPVRRHGPHVRAARAATNETRAPSAPLATGREHDAWLSAVERFERDDPARPTRETAYADWLAERLAGAAELERFEDAPLLRRFRRSRVQRGRPGGKGRGRHGRGTEHPEALMAGMLRVADPEAFAALLANGLGRHKAFGFGMLLLRPPSVPLSGR